MNVVKFRLHRTCSGKAPSPTQCAGGTDSDPWRQAVGSAYYFVHHAFFTSYLEAYFTSTCERAFTFVLRLA